MGKSIEHTTKAGNLRDAYFAKQKNARHTNPFIEAEKFTLNVTNFKNFSCAETIL